MIFSPKLYSKPVAGMILDGTKCQTRRLVKEGEVLGYYLPVKDHKELEKTAPYKFDNAGELGQMIFCEVARHTGKAKQAVLRKKGKVKWFVNQDLSVQLGRGKPGIRKCCHCDKLALLAPQPNGEHQGWLNLDGSIMFDSAFHNFNREIRIVITGIRKERLLDISEADAKKKEGLITKRNFLKKFYELYVKYPFSTKFDKGTSDYESELNRVKEIRKKAKESLDMLSLAIVPDDPMFYWNPEVWVLDFEVKK